MVTCDQLQTGLARYLDTELLTKLEEGSIQKVLIGVAISLYIQKIADIIDQLKSTPAIQILGLIDNQGNIDIDVLKSELEAQVPTSGIKIDIPIIGKMTFHKSDIETLYVYITDGIS